MLQYLVLLGALVQLIGISSYIKDTVKGKTKPNRITWLMWSIAPIIATVAALSEGVTWTIIPTFMAGFGPLLVFIFSFVNKKSYWKLSKFDYICGAFSVLALILWAVTSKASVAIFFSILSDLTASIPTLVKAWKQPETESTAPFSAGIFAQFTAAFAMKSWSFAEIAFPIYLVLINIILILIIIRKKLTFKTANLNK